jgi:hypothetical protein
VSLNLFGCQWNVIQATSNYQSGSGISASGPATLLDNCYGQGAATYDVVVSYGYVTIVSGTYNSDCPYFLYLQGSDNNGVALLGVYTSGHTSGVINYNSSDPANVTWAGCGFLESGVPFMYDAAHSVAVGPTVASANFGTGTYPWNISGTLLGRVQYAPSSVDTCSVVASSTGLTSVYFSTGHDQALTFHAPASGAVLFKMQAFVKGGAGAATSTVFGIVSTTEGTSPGTVVGVLGLAQLTPTATAADNGQLCTMEQIVSVTAGTSYTWYGAAMYSGTATTILAQGTTSQTTVPTGAPYVLEVWAA